jgi:hypothetical protein
VRLANVVIDCANVARLAEFWCALTRLMLTEPEGGEFCVVRARAK